MKKIISVMLALVVLLQCGCGGTKSDTVSMYDLRQTMEAADKSLPEMLNASSADENAADQFAYISDLDYGKVDSFFLSYAKEGTADEIAVVAVKDENDIDEAKQSLETHRQNRRKLLDQYEPEEVKRIDDGLVFAKDQYAVLIICDDASAVKAAFEKAIEQ
jgi:hypothetical protein